MEFTRIARTALAAVVVITAAAVALLTAAAPASAEKTELKASCGSSGAMLVVDLKGYAEGKNTIKIQDGAQVLESREFSRSYVGSFPRPADVAHTFLITVRVAANSRQSFVREAKTVPCVAPRQTPLPPVSTVPTSTTPSLPTVPAPTTTTTAPTVSGSEASSAAGSGSSAPPTTNTGIVPLGSTSELSSAGASVAIPLLIGLCLVSALGVVLVSMKRRRR